MPRDDRSGEVAIVFDENVLGELYCGIEGSFSESSLNYSLNLH
jgi:hypothetical protein